MSFTWLTHRVVPVAILVLPLVAAQSPVLRATPSDRQVLILSPAQDDDRLASTREAIAFWNRTLAELDLPPRLTETALVVASPSSRALENYARRIWQQAGRLPAGVEGPTPPPELIGLAGDIVLFLSKQELMSFAWCQWQPKTAHFGEIHLGRSGRSPVDARRAFWAGRRERSDRNPGQNAPRSCAAGGHVATPSRCCSDAARSQC